MACYRSRAERFCCKNVGRNDANMIPVVIRGIRQELNLELRQFELVNYGITDIRHDFLSLMR
jgi:hypothetical protein